MTSTAPLTSAQLAATSFAYIDSDVPPGLTLAEWRRRRDAARRAERPPRRRFRALRLRPVVVTA
jgi:hypothetical protein